MKILHLITELMPGGAERIVIELCRGQLAAGHSVAVAALKPLRPDSPVVAELRALGVPVSGLELTFFAPWRVRRLCGILRGFDPDVVHAHLFHACLIARLHASRPRRWKLVNTAHICERRRGRGWQFLLERLTLGRCDALTAVSEAVRGFAAHKLGIATDCIHLIRNGIRPPPPVDAAALRADWGVTDCARVLGMVGRLDRQKGFDVVLERLTELGCRIPAGENWALVILGEGAERGALERLAARAPQNVRVVLPGFRADAASCIGAFDLFLMPSRYEGFGLTLAEAMAHGVPVLAAAVDSLPELLAGYPNGTAAEFGPGHGAALAEEIARLAAVRERTPRLPFTLERMLAEYEALYRQPSPNPAVTP